MKKQLFLLIALCILVSGEAVKAQAPVIDLGIFKKSSDKSKLDICLRPAADVVNGAYSGGIFTVRFPASYQVTLSTVDGSAQFGYAFAGPVGYHDGYHYYRYQFAGSVNTVNWAKGREYIILTLQITGDIPKSGRFELVTNDTWTRANNGNYYQELNGAELQRQFYGKTLKMFTFGADAFPQRKVKLAWEYESATTLSHSEPEYSNDGLQFVKLADVPARDDNGRTSAGYEFIHEQPQNVNYYRVRMVDIDGNAEYSSVRVVNFDDPNAEFSVFPNPATGPLTLVSRDPGRFEAGLQYQLSDGTGKILLTGPVIQDNTPLDLSKLAAGTYHLGVLSEKEKVAAFKVVLIQQ